MKKESILYTIIKHIETPLFKILFTPKIEGKEYITDKRVLLAGNHTSIFDCALLMSSCKRNIHFLAKKEIFKFPLGIITKHLGLISVDRSRKDPDAMNYAMDYLNDDKLVLIFPEGTTSKGRGLLEFKKGAAKIAVETKTKIVPFVITGKYRIFSRNLKIEFLKPITIGNDIEKETDRLRNIIKEKLEG